MIIHVFIASFSPAQGGRNQMLNAKFTRPVNVMPSLYVCQILLPLRVSHCRSIRLLRYAGNVRCPFTSYGVVVDSFPFILSRRDFGRENVSERHAMNNQAGISDHSLTQGLVSLSFEGMVSLSFSYHYFHYLVVEESEQRWPCISIYISNFETTLNETS